MKDQLIFDVTDANTIAETDSVGAFLRAGTDGDLISSGDGSSDNVANTFEGIDSRAFQYGYDATGDNWDRLQLEAGAMKVFIDGGDFEVDVVINAEKAEDSPHVPDDIGNYVLAVRQDTLANSTSADGDYGSFKINQKGELYVTDVDGLAKLTEIDTVLDGIKVDSAAIAVSVASIDGDTTTIAGDTTSIDAILTGLSQLEDDLHVSGDAGIMALAVRNDAGTPLAADGDYIPFSMTATGALRVDTGVVSDGSLANTAIASGKTTLAVASTAQDIVAAPLANRKYLDIYNHDNRRMYIGESGVTVADGFPISPGSYRQLRAGAAIDIEFVSSKVGHDLRYLELS